MRIPDFEKLIQETEDNLSPQEEKLRNLIGIVLYLCNHNESSIESGDLSSLCVSDIVYGDLVKAYVIKYGSPPFINSNTKDRIAKWVCNYDTRSMRDIAAAMIGETATRSNNDFLRVT